MRHERKGGSSEGQSIGIGQTGRHRTRRRTGDCGREHTSRGQRRPAAGPSQGPTNSAHWLAGSLTSYLGGTTQLDSLTSYPGGAERWPCPWASYYTDWDTMQNG